jgi:hypothetical protein
MLLFMAVIALLVLPEGRTTVQEPFDLPSQVTLLIARSLNM